MITIRSAEERGRANFGWLDSRHTFSFGNYYDSQHMGFSDLRVINEDRVQPGKGFGTHSHRDMEIISYVLSGELEHKDSIGNGSVILPGDVQRMSAGRGIAHSEFNGSDKDLVHFLQIWIMPDTEGIEPSYEQKNFPLDQRQGQLKLVASQNGRDGSLTIHQDASLYLGAFNRGDRATYYSSPNRALWLQIAKGAIEVNGQILDAGDGAAIAEETALDLLATADRTEILLFDLTKR